MRFNSNSITLGSEEAKILIANYDINLKITAFNYRYKEDFKNLFAADITCDISLHDLQKEYDVEKEIIVAGVCKALKDGFFHERINIKLGRESKTYDFTFSALYSGMEKIGVTHIARDVTEKIKSEKSIKEKEEKYHLVSRSTNDIIFEWNLSSGLFWWNDGIHKLFGYSIDEIVLTKEWWLNKIHPDERDNLINIIDQNIENDISFWTSEYKFKKADGDYAIVMDRSYIMYNDSWEAIRVVSAMTDITENKKIEAALIKREAQFSSLLQNSSDIISILDPFKIFTFVSPSVKQILGYDAEELINKDRRNYLHPEDQELFERTFERVMINKDIMTIQNKFRHKEGHFVIFESTLNNLIEDPAVHGIVINSRDITERMNTQLALIKSEAILKESQKIAKMGSWEWDLVTNNLIWSDELYRINGRPKHLGILDFNSLLKTLTPETMHILRDAVKKAKETGEGYNIDYGRMVGDKMQYLNSVCKPVKNSNGEVVKLQGIVLDITARKETEEKLLESEEWFKTIFNTSRDGFVVELNEKIFYVNEALVELFEYGSEQEILGASITKIIADENVQKIAEYSEKRLKGEDIPNIYETKGRRKDGTVIDVEISASVFSIRGNKYIIASLRDITERKYAEKQLMEQNDELKKINAELDRFVYSASHDLRAPLVSVLGLTNLLKINESDEEKIKYLNLLTKSIHKLDRFIQEIIHHSRNSRVEVRSELIDFQKKIEDTFEDLRYLDEAKNIKVNIEITGESKFYSDSARISIIFNNLISNAIRYSYPEVRTPEIGITVSISDEKAKIRISDNGHGIGSQHLVKIFEMFYRASDKNVGSGLGLYIVKETLIKLGGEIEVFSKVNVGTTFEITIPNSPPVD